MNLFIWGSYLKEDNNAEYDPYVISHMADKKLQFLIIKLNEILTLELDSNVYIRSIYLYLEKNSINCICERFG